MLSGPANDYFSDTHHLRGGFPTPNESSLRSGLTPGGSGSMFPAPSPNSQALFAQLASGGATPSTLDFHRTALSAAAKREQSNGPQPQHQQQQQQPAKTSQPQDMPNGTTTIKTEAKAPGPFDPHDNDAANGLFMLAQGAQGRSGSQSTGQFTATSAPGHAHPAPAPAPQMPEGNGGSARGGSEGSMMSEEPEPAKPSTRGKGKKNNTTTTNGRRKADDAPAKAPPAKKAKGNAIAYSGSVEPSDDDEDDEDKFKTDENGTKTKMTDEEKRKNFLERNRCVPLRYILIRLCINTRTALPLSSVVSVRSSGWRTFKPRSRCSARRTTPSQRKSRSCERKSSTSKLSSLRIKTAQSLNSRVFTEPSCHRLSSHSTRR